MAEWEGGGGYMEINIYWIFLYYVKISRIESYRILFLH